jgi:hypothetical protein
MKEIEVIRKLSRLTWLVAFLGSKSNANWWDCSLMDGTGLEFLKNVFPRSAAEAAFRATTEAAQRAHDLALGRMGCYHLFRFPLPVEEQLSKFPLTHLGLISQRGALTELAGLADASINAPEGPVQVGVARRILTPNAVNELAAHYHSAFSRGIRCYPYFSAV